MQGGEVVAAPEEAAELLPLLPPKLPELIGHASVSSPIAAAAKRFSVRVRALSFS